MSISPESLKIINATKGVVAENSIKITSAFYPRMLKNNPEVLQFFNLSNQRKGAQPRALADSIVAYAVNIEDLGKLDELVQRVAHKHCALNVKPEHYKIVHDNLMGAIAEVLGDAVTPEVAAAWSEAVNALAMIFIKVEDDLYKRAASAKGGWNGRREFVVKSRQEEARDIVSLTLAPADGTAIIDHTPGQYITVCTNPTDQQYFAPRHYTITSQPGSPTYRITPKLLHEEGHEDGVMSSYLAGKLKEGDKVDLFPPFGPSVFRSKDDGKATVFISAGIGITPWANLIPMAASKGTHIVLFHADSSSETHALRKELEAALPDNAIISYSYSRAVAGDSELPHISDGRMDVNKIISVLKDNNIDLAGTQFYLSTRPELSVTLAENLQKAGIAGDAIRANEFGPHRVHTK